MSTGYALLRLSLDQLYPLHSTRTTRDIEMRAQAALPIHTLMRRAGASVANLACALAPHARSVWVACGPGNNGGDGLEAAMHLQQRGFNPVVTLAGQADNLPADAHSAWERAVAAGVSFADTPPPHPHLCIDAMLGIGSTRAPEGKMAHWITHMNHCGVPVLAVDIPTGLNADTGAGHNAVCAHHTLSLLTLKPGLFTAQGRDASGQVWWDSLGVDASSDVPSANLYGRSHLEHAHVGRHDSHKGSRGDVAVVGGAIGMTGAALLAATAALHSGAGRVFVSLLDDHPMDVYPQQPELMFRHLSTLALETVTVVCGCGGGTAVAGVLPEILDRSHKLVLDADALNAIAADASLQTLLQGRRNMPMAVLTPHPLEAARLLGTDTSKIQADRLGAAERLATLFGCVVALKGSGTIVAAPGQTTTINPTGNARLATGGTGDVLAGLLAARLAGGMQSQPAACAAVYQHGLLADQWPVGTALTAGTLAARLS